MTAPFALNRCGRVATLILTRPQALNTLTRGLLAGLTDALVGLESDPGIGCIVLTGTGRAFSAGADIAEMEGQSAAAMLAVDHFAGWQALATCRLPKIAAVNGLALGGGCELAMLCDIVIAAESARFAQPEIALGVIPGIGGTQRLTRLVGRLRAMELILTGRQIDAAEALRIGLVTSVVADAELPTVAAQMAARIAGFPRAAAMLAREAVARADETPLADGLLFERRVFHGLFGLPDQIEGMSAFRQKRPPRFHPEKEGA